MRIGMGGGAASSMAAGANAAELDFDSVQRGNPEIQRRAQEVINHCWALGEHNPILAIHDVGAGGISNAFPELVDGAGKGARFDLRKVPLEESGLAPKEIWCNESQERYVLARRPGPAAAVRRDVRARALPVRGRRRGAPTSSELRARGRPERRARRSTCRWTCCSASRRRCTATCSASRADGAPLDLTGVELEQVAFDVLRHPTVASKRFLITIGDRTVGGLTHRDPMVGPWQVPVADCAVTLADYARLSRRGDGMGERTPLAALDAPASGRMAVGEAITNLLAAPIELDARQAQLQLDGRLRRAAARTPRCTTPCKAVGMELCPALGIGVPVGKDSLSMRTRWSDGSGEPKQVTAPVSLIVSGLRHARRRAPAR